MTKVAKGGTVAADERWAKAQELSATLRERVTALTTLAQGVDRYAENLVAGSEDRQIDVVLDNIPWCRNQLHATIVAYARALDTLEQLEAATDPRR